MLQVVQKSENQLRYIVFEKLLEKPLREASFQVTAFYYLSILTDKKTFRKQKEND